MAHPQAGELDIPQEAGTTLMGGVDYFQVAEGIVHIGHTQCR